MFKLLFNFIIFPFKTKILEKNHKPVYKTIESNLFQRKTHDVQRKFLKF